MQMVNLKIDGMTCGGCAKSVNKVLSEIKGVSDVQVDWQNGSAVVQFDATQTEIAVLIDAVENAGFDVQAA